MYRGLDIAAVLTCVVGAAGLAFSIVQFSQTQQQANKVPFLQRQMDLGFQAVDTVAQLATETDSQNWEKARIKFWRLYWGTLSIVEDQNVERQMVKIGRMLPPDGVTPPTLPAENLRRPSLELAKAVRDMSIVWDVKLPDIEDSR